MLRRLTSNRTQCSIDAQLLWCFVINHMRTVKE